MMEGERSMEQQKLEVMQNTTKGTRNHSSVAYDFVTLEYHATPAGQQNFSPPTPPPSSPPPLSLPIPLTLSIPLSLSIAPLHRTHTRRTPAIPDL